MSNILLSIIVPVYNCEKYIEQTIHSIIQQPGRGLELIIVDDGSTDRTPDILRKYNKFPVRVISKENEGVSSARNLGISKARGLYINFCDHDDIVARGVYTNKIADILEGNKYDIVTFSDGFSDEKVHWGKIIHRIPGYFEGSRKDLKSDVRCSHQHSLWRKAMLHEHVLFPPGAKFNEDWNFVGMAWDCARNVMAIDKLWYIWRMIPTSVSHNYSKSDKIDVHYWTDSYMYAMENTNDLEELKGIAKVLLMHSFKSIYYSIFFDISEDEVYNKWKTNKNVRFALDLVGEEYMNEVSGWRMFRNDPEVFHRYVKKEEGKYQFLKKLALFPPIRRLNQRFRLQFTEDMRRYRPD